MPFPVELQQKIESLLTGEKLDKAAQDISERYRRLSGENFQIANEAEAKAYALTRMPATYAAVSDVLTRLNNIWPDMNPENLLDLGAGPGTASLAALEIWQGAEAHLIERNSYLAKIGQQLLRGNWTASDLNSFTSSDKYDLVIASYAFNEIRNFEELLSRYWNATNKAFALIEPGTPHGYDVIIKARDFFLNNGGFITAPCPHYLTCPLQNSEKWCHFSVRLQRSHAQLKAKGASLGYEDEKFSYLVVTRKEFEKPTFRTLGHPHGEKLVEIETCQSNGRYEVVRTSKRDPDFKRLKKLDWGDAFYE